MRIFYSTRRQESRQSQIDDNPGFNFYFSSKFKAMG